jgi:hypothetical protein
LVYYNPITKEKSVLLKTPQIIENVYDPNFEKKNIVFIDNEGRKYIF